MNLSDELERDRRNARQFSSSLMSNAKWRSLIAALEDAHIDTGEMRVKFTDSDTIHTTRALHTETPHAFVDTMEFGPFPLVAIEWLEFQNDPAIRTVLEATGKQFPLEETPTGLRVVGHRR